MTRRAMNALAPAKSARSKVMTVPDGSRRRRSSLAAMPPAPAMSAAPVAAAAVNLSDDEDDDVRITSPRRFEQAKTAASGTRQRSRGGTLEVVVSVPDNRVVHEEMTELRLGLSSFNGQPFSFPAGPSSRPSEGERVVDLTNPSEDAEDCILVNEFQQKKRKVVEAPPKELKLSCAICMDAMHEETSTICGHLFCRRCILHAISTSKKCPTCRKSLTSSQTHRIYLSASVRG